MHPERKAGQKIFNRDKEAVNLLKDYLEYPELDSLVTRLVRLDYATAELTVDEADAACGGSKKCTKAVSKARKDLAKAIDYADEGKPGNAINSSRSAWKRTAKYVPEGAGKGVDLDEDAQIEIDEIDQVPTEFALEQNYPNPFNPVTTIAFAIPQSVHVNLVVFDALGREVGVLVNGSMEAGRHQVRFDASSLPSGIYLYRITAGSNTRVAKMVLLK